MRVYINLVIKGSDRWSPASCRLGCGLYLDPPRNGQVFILVITLFLVKIMSPMFHPHFYLDAALPGKRKKPGNLKKQRTLEIGECCIEKYMNYSFS